VRGKNTQARERERERKREYRAAGVDRERAFFSLASMNLKLSGSTVRISPASLSYLAGLTRDEAARMDRKMLRCGLLANQAAQPER